MSSLTLGLSVVRVDEVQVVTEDGITVLVLGERTILSTVLLLPLEEGSVVLTLAKSVGASNECDEKECDLHI